MRPPSSEAFIFFNIDGIRRILGLGSSMGKTLPMFFGGENKAQELLGLIANQPTEIKEKKIINYYANMLRNETKAKYVIPFRVEAEHKRMTSHYLLHVSSHPLGFRIMKDVMWSLGIRAEGVGGLEFAQASLRREQPLFDMQMSRIKDSIVNTLRYNNQVRANFFYTELVQRPDNMISAKGYKEALLELEAEGNILVLTKDGSGNLAGKRRKGTLAGEYYLCSTHEI